MINRRMLAILLALAMLLGLSAVPAAAADIWSFRLVADAAPASDGLWTVTLSGSGLRSLYAYEALLEYDASQLELVRATHRLAGFAVAPQTKNGRTTVAFTCIGSTEGVSGTADLCTLVFRGRVSGTATLALARVKAVDTAMSAHVAAPAQTLSVRLKGAVVSQKPVLNASTGTATAGITIDEFTVPLGSADLDRLGRSIVRIELEAVQGAVEYVERIPAALVTEPAATHVLSIRTPIGTMDIPGNLFKPAELAGEDDILASIRVQTAVAQQGEAKAAEGRPAVTFALATDARALDWSSRTASVRILFPYSPSAQELASPEQLVVLGLGSDGSAVAFPSGFYGATAGMASFRTTSVGRFGLAFRTADFIDLSSHDWAASDIRMLAVRGIVNGVSPTAYAPGSAVTRADFLCLLVRAMGLSSEPDASAAFSDVPSGAYYADAVQTARTLGIANGSDGAFHPKASITRQEMMALVQRALATEGLAGAPDSEEALSAYSDAELLADWAKAPAAALTAAGIIEGSGGRLRPDGTLTRAEAAVLIARICRQIN